MNGLSFSDWSPVTKSQATNFDHLTPLNPHLMFDFPRHGLRDPTQFLMDAQELTHVSGSEYNCGTIGDTLYCRRRKATNPRDPRYRHVLAETIWWELEGLMEGFQSRHPIIEMRAGDIDNDGDIDFAYRDLETGVIMVATQEYSGYAHLLERLDNLICDLGFKDPQMKRLAEYRIRVEDMGF